METLIIFVGAAVIGLLIFIALTLTSISNDLFKIKQILNNHEREQTELHENE